MKITLKINATDSDIVEMVTEPYLSLPTILWGTFHLDMIDDVGMRRLLEEDGEVEVNLTEA